VRAIHSGHHFWGRYPTGFYFAVLSSGCASRGSRPLGGRIKERPAVREHCYLEHPNTFPQLEPLTAKR